MHCDELESLEGRGALLAQAPNALQRDEAPAKELDGGQADGLPGVVSKEKIKVFVGGKKAKVRTKRKDIDNYLKLFINAHRLPHNTSYWHIHLNVFFSNHGGSFFHCPYLIVYSFFIGDQHTERLLCEVYDGSSYPLL